MITHIVIFSWKPWVTQAQVDSLRQALSRMATEVADLGSIRHGQDLKFRDGNGDYALIATFADHAGWEAYQAHPAHKAFVRDVVSPMLTSRLTIQF